MDNKKTRILRTITFSCITIALLTICTNTFAQPGRITDADPNITKTFIVKNIDPNIAAKSITQIVKLKIFNISKETVIIPNHNENMLTVQTENSDQMDVIEELIENFDFQITNEGTISRKVIKLTNRIFDEAQRIISPVLSSAGHLSYNLTAQTLIVTDTAENMTHIENLVKIIDSTNFDDPRVALQFSGLKIEQITPTLKLWTGKEVVPSQDAKDIKITVFTPQRLKRNEAIKVLYNAIRQRGCTIEETNDTIYIKAPPQKPETAQIIEPNEPPENIPDKDEEQKIFKLKYEKPSIIGQLILPYLSSNGNFTADDSTNTLTIQDDTQTLVKIEQMIDVFDADPNSLPKGGLIRPLNTNDPNEQASSQNILRPESEAAASVDEMVSVNLSGMNIDEIVQILQTWTGKKVEPSQEAMDIKLTGFSPESMKRSDAIQLLYSAIRQQCFWAEETDDTIYIKPAPLGHPPFYQLLDPNDSLGDIEDKDTIARKTYKLKNYNSTEMGKLLVPLIGPSGDLMAESTTNTLMVTDTVKNLINIEHIIETLDTDSNSLTIDNLIPSLNPDDPNEQAQRTEHDAIYVKFINADLAAKKLNEILTEMQIDTKSRLVILPLATSKQVLVFGENKEDRELAQNLIHDIDYQAAEDSYAFERISLTHLDTKHFSDFVTKTIEEFKNLRLSLYPIAPSKQILVFGEKGYRDVISSFVENIDIPLENIESQTFQLKYIDSAKAAKIFNEIFSLIDTNDNDKILFEDINNQLSVNADLDIILKTKNILKEIDTQSFENAQEYDIIRIKHSIIKEYTYLLISILKEIDIDNNNINIIPLVEQKLVLIYGNKDDCIETKKRLEDLDEASPTFDIILIKHADMKELISNIETITAHLDINIKANFYLQPLFSSKQLLVSGNKEYKDTIKYIVSLIDTKPVEKAQKYVFIPIRYIDVNELAATLHSLLEDSDIGYKDKVSIVPLPELKHLFVFGDNTYCEIVQNLVAEPTESQLVRKSFKLKYAKVEDVKRKIDELFGGKSISPDEFVSNNNTKQKVLSDDTVITTIYPSLNEIVVLASKERMKEIEKQIYEWDSPIAF